MKNTELAQKIKELRSRKGFSQEQLADVAQINLRTVQRIESGEVEPRGDTMKRIAIAFDITPDELIDWAEQEDKGLLAFINLSALSFIAFPLLGIIVPLAVWMMKKDRVRSLNDTGKRLLNFQISWCLLLFTGYILFFTMILGLWNISLPRTSMFNIGITEFMLIFIVPFLYLINIILIIINSIRSYKGKKVFYQPAFRFLK